MASESGSSAAPSANDESESSSHEAEAAGPETARLDPTPGAPEIVSEPRDQSPIEALLGAEADPVELSALYGAAEVEVAELATVCVKRAGYEHVVVAEPAPPPESFIPNVRTTSDLMREYGYSVWIVDQAIKTLSESRSLVPPESRITAEIAADGEFFQIRATCQAEARAQVAFFREQSTPEEVASLIAEFRESLWSSPQVALKWSEWSRCMAEQGYAFADRQAIMNEMGPPASALLSQVIQLTPGPDFSVPEPVLNDLERLRATENLTLSADLSCAEDVELDSYFQQFEHERELDFVAEYGDFISLALAEAD